jgi:hypothetical protein
MSFLKKIFSSAPAQTSASFYAFKVQCGRCGEIIEGRINLANDLSADYQDDHIVYHVRKVLMGSGRCFQRIEVQVDFDASRKAVDHQASGGRFLESSQ